MRRFVLYAVEGAVFESEAPAALRPCANAQREVDLCGPFTHALLSTFASDAEAHQMEIPQVMGPAEQRRPPIVLHYEPVVVLAAEEPAHCLRHVFFSKFKPGADVEALIAGCAV